MKKLLTLLMLLAVYIVRGQPTPYVVSNNDVTTAEMASYDTGGAPVGHFWGVTFSSAWPLEYPNLTNHWRPIGQSGASIQDFWIGGANNEGEEKDGLPMWWYGYTNHGQVRHFQPVDDNGGFGSNAVVEWLTNIFNSPALFNMSLPYNGTTENGTVTNEGYSFPVTFIPFGNTVHDSAPQADGGAGVTPGTIGAQARNTGSTNLAGINNVPIIDLWDVLMLTNNPYLPYTGTTWQQDLTNNRYLGFQPGSHPNQGGFVAMTIASLCMLGFDTNVGTLTLDLGAATAKTNHFVVTSITTNNGVYSCTVHCDRMPFGWIEQAGTITNQGSMCFQAIPAMSTWFTWSISGTNFPAGNYNMFWDGQIIDRFSVTSSGIFSRNLFTNMLGSQWAQRQAVVFRTMDLYGISNYTTLAQHDAGQGGSINGPNGLLDMVNYLSWASQYYNADGERGSQYVASMTPISTNLLAYDAAIYAAAQQTNHTLIISPAGTVIGNETLLSLPSGANLIQFVGDHPDDGSVQGLNPPIVKWVYEPEYFHLPNETDGANGTNIQRHAFQFQLSTNAGATFSSLYFNVTTSNNFENCLYPITNADGSIWTGTNYWRVVYWNSNFTVAQGTGDVHYFTLSPTATPWDRSMLANTNYLFRPHPYMFFTPTNRDAIHQFEVTNTALGWSWTAQSNAAAATTLASWWTNKTVFTNASPYNSGRDPLIVPVAFFAQMTTNLIWLTNCAIMADMDASAYVQYGIQLEEPYQVEAIQKNLALLYDWTFPYMTVSQRTNVLATIVACENFMMLNDWWYIGTNTVPFYSAAKNGQSHPRHDQGAGVFLSIATLPDSPTSLWAFDYFMNYSIAQVDPFNLDEGRGYAEQSFRSQWQFSAHLLETMLFPEAKLTNNPWYAEAAQHFAYWEPVQYNELTDQFGDYGLNGSQYFHDKYYALARMLQNGAIQRQYDRQYNFRKNTPDFFPYWGDAFLGYYFPTTPAEADWPNTFYTNVYYGFVVALDNVPPDDYGAYTNHVGMVITGRPAGDFPDHAQWHDGALDIWAYGAQVTVGGSEYYYKHPMLTDPLFVDGIGTQNFNKDPNETNYSRITAFTNCPSFTFVQVDLTRSFNRSNFVAVDVLDNLVQNYYAYATNKRPDIVSIQRSVLFMHVTNRAPYFLVYDTFQTTVNRHFQMKLNIEETNHLTLNSNVGFFSYTSSNWFSGTNVTTYVQEVVNSNLVNMIYMPGTNNALRNPFTGEDYNSTFNSTPGAGTNLWNGTVWMQNATATTNWDFLTVMFPAKPGATAPIITPLDNNTASVNDGIGTDIDTFGTGYNGTSTVEVNVNTIGGGKGGGGGGGGGSGGPGVKQLTAVHLILN